jgi:hypothetical protein
MKEQTPKNVPMDTAIGRGTVRQPDGPAGIVVLNPSRMSPTTVGHDLLSTSLPDRK